MSKQIKTTIIKIYCPSCNNSTNHKILKKESRIYGDYEQGESRWTIEWQIIECLGCETISGRELKSFEDDFDPETGKHYEHEILYPKRGENILQVKTFLNLPINLRPIYRETIDAFNNQSPILCSAGLRALIEGICTELKIEDGPVPREKNGIIEIIRKKDLSAKISGLYEKGLLTKVHADTLHKHRFLGNKGLHSLQQPSTSDLQLAIEIVEHTFDNLFEIGPKARRIGNSPKFGILGEGPTFD